MHIHTYPHICVYIHIYIYMHCSPAAIVAPLPTVRRYILPRRSRLLGAASYRATPTAMADEAHFAEQDIPAADPAAAAPPIEGDYNSCLVERPRGDSVYDESDSTVLSDSSYLERWFRDATQKPAIEKPVMKKPAMKKPATKEPARKEPAMKKPAKKEPT